MFIALLLSFLSLTCKIQFVIDTQKVLYSFHLKIKYFFEYKDVFREGYNQL